MGGRGSSKILPWASLFDREWRARDEPRATPTFFRAGCSRMTLASTWGTPLSSSVAEATAARRPADAVGCFFFFFGWGEGGWGEKTPPSEREKRARQPTQGSKRTTPGAGQIGIDTDDGLLQLERSSAIGGRMRDGAPGGRDRGKGKIFWRGEWAKRGTRESPLLVPITRIANARSRSLCVKGRRTYPAWRPARARSGATRRNAWRAP